MKQIILTVIIMSSFSELDGSILRDTSNPPLTDKGSELTYSEFDGNFVKQYNAIQDIVSDENVEAYDNAATYDAYSTDVYEQYCGYDSRIWKAVYVGSPSSFSGQTPAEGAYWTQVSLAQLLPNIMSLADLSYATAARRGCCPQFCTAWQSFTNKDLNSNPVDITDLAAPGAGKIIVPKFIMFALDYNSVAYNFSAFTGINLIYAGHAAGLLGTIPGFQINGTADIYTVQPITSSSTAVYVNTKMQLYATADATVGDGTYYIKVIYQIEDAPF